MAGVPPAQLGSLWSSLEDQRGDAPLLSSAWSLPGAEPMKAKGILRRAGAAVARAWAEMWAFARSDRRNPVFAAKVGLALALVSLLAFLREPHDVAGHAVWAVLTVVVVFEYNIGTHAPSRERLTRRTTPRVPLRNQTTDPSSPRRPRRRRLRPEHVNLAGFRFECQSMSTCATLSRGLNRGLGTLVAGGLALAVAESSKNLGKMEGVILIMSTFTVGFCTVLAKLHPKMKPYEYGFRVSLLTFGYVMVSGYNTGTFTDTAVSRFAFIALGAAVSLGINIGINPIWAGEDLHNLIANNFAGVAKSLEGCVDGYLKCMEYERISSKILNYQASDDPIYSGYRAAVEASAEEEILLDFAIWEPPHGPYKMMSYPWKSFTKVGGALRHCSVPVMALHGCILSEIQAPVESRRVFIFEIHRVGREGAKVLREIGNNVKTMTKLRSSDILCEVHLAAEELQRKIDEKSYLLVNTEKWDTSKRAEGIKDGMNGTSVMSKGNENGVTEPTIADQISVHHYKSFAGSSFLSRYSSSSTNDRYRRLPSWPARRSFHPNFPLEDEESKTYESASALSLATFASLLIEFVARLQNVVNAFEELSEKANFKDPVEEPFAVSKGDGGFVAKLCANV